MKTEHEWNARVVRLLAERMLSQQELAALCGVAQQTVSAWVAGKSAPGYFARRNLLALEKEGVPPGTTATATGGKAVARQVTDGDDPAVQELAKIAQRLTPQSLRELLQFAQFKERQVRDALAVSAVKAYPPGARRKSKSRTQGNPGASGKS